jgi:mannose PTS system EIIA component
LIHTLILTHGSLAEALLETASRITGEVPGLQALSLDWNEPREVLQERVVQVLRRLDQGEGVLILTDLYGDTPSNLALSVLEPGRVEVVTGVNLPMVLRVGCLREHSMGVTELARWIQQKGKQGIRVGTGVMTPAGEPR